jgi:hypothetical protein
MFGVNTRKLKIVANMKNNEKRNLGYFVEHEEQKAVNVGVVQHRSPSITSGNPNAVIQFPIETHV